MEKWERRRRGGNNGLRRGERGGVGQGEHMMGGVQTEEMSAVQPTGP